jgi:hypothetical protein
MVNLPTKSIAFWFACALAVIASLAGIKANKTLNSKAVAQEGVTQSLERWHQSYQALGESRVKWAKSFQREDSVQDVISLIGLLDLNSYGLLTDTDSVVLTKVEQIKHNDAVLGLTKICMGTGTGDGGALEVKSQNYQTLLNGIEMLAKRSDIYIGNIALQGDKGVPIARLGEFCILLRNN